MKTEFGLRLTPQRQKALILTLLALGSALCAHGLWNARAEREAAERASREKRKMQVKTESMRWAVERARGEALLSVAFDAQMKEGSAPQT